jgi:dTDP-4-amino-4,6-dideoxygalactose transaminase
MTAMPAQSRTPSGGVKPRKPRMVASSDEMILLSRPTMTGREADAVADAIARNTASAGGHYSKRCEALIAATMGRHAMLTPSCTAALEFACVLADLKPGDEVIVPSFTFSSTANAIVLQGAVPVFVDIRADTLNLDERLVEAAVTPKTRAVLPVHYAGIPAEMDEINSIARRHNLLVIEDAAQAYGSTYRGRPAGALGDMGAFSFHATKNLHCGEGGALVVDERLAERGEIVREKGTNRTKFIRGEIDKYTWVDAGSSYLLNEISAAYLEQQLLHADEVNAERLTSWDKYHAALEELEHAGQLRRPIVPAHVTGNGHIYYILMPTSHDRDALQVKLRAARIQAVSHYEPLHKASAGQRFGRVAGPMMVTDSVAGRLLRLPLYYQMGEAADRVIEFLQAALGARS